MITVSPELLATMRMLPRLLVIAAVSAAFVLPAASFVRKPEQAIKESDAGATPLSPTQKLLQPVQLAVAVGLLVELPCYACGRPALGWRLSIEYFAFFAVVSFSMMAGVSVFFPLRITFARMMFRKTPLTASM